MAIGSLALSAFRSPGKLWKGYNAALQQSPLQTKALTCATAYAMGDVAAQLSSSRCERFHHKVAALDVTRTCRMAMFGLMWTGCVGHYFYTNLDKIMAQRALKPLAEVVSKVGIDQLMYSPAATAAFYVWMNLSSNTLANVSSDLSTKLVPTVQASWAMWVPAMTINMAVVPSHLRILWINAVVIAWTLILSNMASSSATIEVPMVLGNDAIVPLEPPLVPVAGPVAESAEGCDYDDDCMLPQPLGTVGEVLALSALPACVVAPAERKSGVLRDVWHFMRGSEQPRRSSKAEAPPARRFLNFNISKVASARFFGLGLSRAQSFAAGGDDTTMLDAVLDEVSGDGQLPSTPGATTASDAGSLRSFADFGGLPVDPRRDCLS